ncbi:MAG: hypothetical protein IJ566_02605 [Cardiobacteriaceae bacterium]|nr:hypothetical protein [Cardiobacteriaceae bacterium]
MRLLDTPKKQSLSFIPVCVKEGFTLFNSERQFWLMISSLCCGIFLLSVILFVAVFKVSLITMFFVTVLEFALGGLLFSYFADECCGKKMDFSQLPNHLLRYFKDSNFWLFVVFFFCVKLLITQLLMMTIADIPQNINPSNISKEELIRINIETLKISGISLIFEYYFFWSVLPLMSILPQEKVFILMRKTWHSGRINIISSAGLFLFLMGILILGFEIASLLAKILPLLGLLGFLLFFSAYIPFAAAIVFRAVRHIYIE